MSFRVLVVIPAYNEAARLPRLLDAVASHGRGQGGGDAPFELQFLVVDDGSAQEEYDAARHEVAVRGMGHAVRVVRHERNRGKGAAVRTGFEQGLREGFDYLGFMDADGSVPVGEVHRLAAYLVRARPDGVSAVIGSRVRLLGRDIVVNPLRHYGGRVFATFVASYYRQPVYDTQCGLKIFERRSIERFLDVPTDTRWVWDTELLLAMLCAGERVHEVPIDWRETGHSKLSLWRDPLVMLWRLLWFRRRLNARRAAAGRAERV